MLDTHIALSAVVNDPRLSTKATKLIDDPANEVFISTASLGEIAIKHALARYVTDGRREVDNNIAENAMRAIARRRKNSPVQHRHT